jgi:hypothetical protein
MEQVEEIRWAWLTSKFDSRADEKKVDTVDAGENVVARRADNLQVRWWS